MSRNKATAAAVMMMLFMTCGTANAVPSGPFGYDLQADMHRDEQPKVEQNVEQENRGDDVNRSIPVRPTDAKQFYSFVPLADLYTSSVDRAVYYPNATVNSAIAKYKSGN